MTNSEKLLWSKIRGRQLENVQFYRQKPIGKFVVDFYCPKVRLAIELDGGQHFSRDGMARDSQRDQDLMNLRVRVLRFMNNEVMESLESVLEKIRSVMNSQISPSPSLQKRGKAVAL
jgi:very-short-patch-repair endonuclease